jgi:hypothetical protein
MGERGGKSLDDGGGGGSGGSRGSGMGGGASSGVEHTPGMLVDGPQRVFLGEVPAGGEVRADITCIPLLPGVGSGILPGSRV